MYSRFAFAEQRMRILKSFKSKGRKRTVTAAQQKRAATKRANKRKHPRG